MDNNNSSKEEKKSLFGFLKSYKVSLRTISVLIGIIIAIMTLSLNLKSCWRELNASIYVTINSKEIQSNDTTTTVICLEDSSQIIDMEAIKIVPSFYNPLNYPLADFSLSFDVKNENVDFSPTDLYSKEANGINRFIYRCKEKKLDGNSEEAPYPFLSCKLNKNIGKSHIVSKVSFMGLDVPYKYYTDVLFCVIPKLSDYNEWTKTCKDSISKYVGNRKYDVFYYGENDFLKLERNNVPLVGNNNISTDSNSNIEVEDNSQDYKYDIKSYCFEGNGREDYPWTLYITLNKQVNDSEDETCLLHYKHKNDKYIRVVIPKGKAICNVVFDKKVDFNQLDVLKEKNLNDYIDVKRNENDIELKNKTDNLVVCMVYSQNRNIGYYEIRGNENFKILNNNNIIKVFHTGKKKSISQLHQRLKDIFIPSPGLNSVLFILGVVFIIFSPLYILIDNFFENKKEYGSYKKSFKQIKRRFSYKVLKDNLKNEPWFIQLLLIFGFVLNYFSLFIGIPFIIVWVLFIVFDIMI